MKIKFSVTNIFISIGILINILLIYFIYISPVYPVYDEIFFYDNFHLLLKNGWSKSYLVNIQNQAPGPLYQTFYYILYKLGATVTIHLTRYCSLLFFNFGLWIYLKSIPQLTRNNFWVIYFSVFSVPFIYPILGMGLTETISMFFLSSAIYFFNKYINKKIDSYIVLFSIFYSIALIGRQNFLITFPCFFLVLIFEKESILNKLKSLFISSLSFLPLMYFVLIWGGIVPPQQKMVSGSSIFGVSFEHGVLGLAYYGILFFLINPVFFAKNISYRILLVALMISIFIELGFKIQFMPFSSLLNKFPQILYLFTFIIPTLLISIGLYFIFNLVVILMKIRTNKKEYFFILLNLSMALSCFKVIHLFSSRYIAQACYFATGFSKEKESKKGQLVSLILLVVGSFAGLYSLYAYYKT